MTADKIKTDTAGHSGGAPDATPETTPDAGLVERARNGDRQAFNMLITKYKDRIYSLCFWYLNDHQEADDAAQETFIKIFTSLKAFRQDAAFSTWAHRIAINTCKNKRKSLYFRFSRRKKIFDEPDANGRLMEIADDGSHPATWQPDVQLDRKETGAAIQQAISRLNEKKRMVVLLRDIQGFSYEEIAKITAMNLGTVRSTLARAREELKQQLKRVIIK